MGAAKTSKPDQAAHRALATWALGCAARVLAHFEAERPTDARVCQALEAGRAWVRGELPMSQARKFAFSAHAAARDALGPAARAAARAAGQAAGTAHVAGHARHAAAYARKSVRAATVPAERDAAEAREMKWQQQQLAPNLWPWAFAKTVDYGVD